MKISNRSGENKTDSGVVTVCRPFSCTHIFYTVSVVIFGCCKHKKVNLVIEFNEN